jgi:hypothetical protein
MQRAHGWNQRACMHGRKRLGMFNDLHAAKVLAFYGALLSAKTWQLAMAVRLHAMSSHALCVLLNALVRQFQRESALITFIKSLNFPLRRAQSCLHYKMIFKDFNFRQKIRISFAFYTNTST